MRLAVVALVGLVFGVLRTISLDGCAPPTWNPPIGVPPPSFGIENQMPAPPENWSQDTIGFWWVDNTHPQATDSPSGRHGYPNLPRRTIPSSSALSAGDVVVIAAGTYGQDPYGLSAQSTLLPGLYDLPRMNSLPAQAEERELLFRELIRQRNRLADSLREVRDLANRTAAAIAK